MSLKKLSLIMATVSVIGVIGSVVLSRFNMVTPIEERLVFNQTEASAVNALDVEEDILIFILLVMKKFYSNFGASTRGSCYTLSTGVVDETLRVELSERQFGRYNISFRRFRNRVYTLNYLPQKQYDFIKVDGKVGSIRQENLKATGLYLNSRVGNIELERIISK